MARILIAEDEEAIREFLRRGLALRGHDVAAVGDGLAALEALRQKSFDLLITDIVMPLMDGLELSLAAARDYPALRIILMTGYAAERQRAHNLDALVHDVVSKPFSLDQMAAAVTKALAPPAR
ncbi:MAG TPA: response regulator [Alphaproteobacteria bacterium]|nr:response regulator [Alphaproteobacteria bacterium]